MRTKLSIKACFKTNENICNIKKIILKQPTSKFLKKEFKKIRNQKPKSFQQINNVKQKRKKLGHLNSVQNNKKMILDLYGREIHRASNNTNCTNNNLKNIVLIKNKLSLLPHQKDSTSKLNQKWTKFYKKFQVLPTSKIQNSQTLQNEYSCFDTARPKLIKYLYKERLIMRQKLKFFYGFTRTKQFKKEFFKVKSTPKQFWNNKGFVETFLHKIETRLDMFLYRLNIVNSVQEGKQLISHNKLRLNNKKFTFYNYNLKPGDIISFIDPIINKRLKNLPFPTNIVFNNQLNIIIYNNQTTTTKYPFKIDKKLLQQSF